MRDSENWDHKGSRNSPAPYPHSRMAGLEKFCPNSHCQLGTKLVKSQAALCPTLSLCRATLNITAQVQFMDQFMEHLPSTQEFSLCFPLLHGGTYSVLCRCTAGDISKSWCHLQSHLQGLKCINPFSISTVAGTPSLAGQSTSHRGGMACSAVKSSR